MFLGLEFNVSTFVVLLIIAGLVFLSCRRLFVKGLCDCHADTPRGKKGKNTSCASCHSTCASCSACAVAENVQVKNKK